MSLKSLIRPLPGAQKLSRVRQRASFVGSAAYWEQRYAHGGTSGDGSYGSLAADKARVLNTFVRDYGISSVIEFGCGDGNQLSLSDYPRYIGLDVSSSALAESKCRFADDPTKSFFRYDGTCFVDRDNVFSADLALSLDVIYHLVEDEVFETYMSHLFDAARRFVIVYSSDTLTTGTAPHVRHRHYSLWVATNRPDWVLKQVVPGPEETPADFFFYAKAGATE